VVRRYLSLTIVLAREVVEEHIHACKPKTEHFWLAVWANCYLEKLHNSLETISGQLVAPGYVKCSRSHWQ
jgi:hypothetical protein